MVKDRVAGRLMTQPVYPQFRKCPCVPALTLRASTKSLRSSPLRGSKSREAGSQLRG
jgi:hypothetical protein